MNDDQFPAANSLNINIESVFQPEIQAQIRDWLTDGQTLRSQKEELLQALLDFEDDCGGFYRDRAFLLAAEYLAFCPECRQGDAIVDRLLKLSYAYFRVEKADWCMPPEALVRSARETLKRTDLERVVPRFEAMIRQTESRQVMRYAANALLTIQPGNRCAIAAIAFDRLIPTKDQEYNYYHKPSPLEIKALRAIVTSPIASDEAAQAISQLLIDQSRTEDFLTLKQLIQHSPNHPLVICKLLNLTEDAYDYESDYDDEKIRLRPHIDQLWQELSQLNHNCVSNLIRIAEAGKYTAFTAIRVLAKLSPGCESVAYAAIDLLAKSSQEEEEEGKYPPFWDMLLTLFDNIAEIKVCNFEIMAILLAIFRSSQKPLIQYRAAITLKKLDPTHAEATAWLFDAIHSVEKSGFETFLSDSFYISDYWEVYALSLSFEDIRPTAIAIWTQAIQEDYHYNFPTMLKEVGCVPAVALQHWRTKLVMDLEVENWICCVHEDILRSIDKIDKEKRVTAAIRHLIQHSTDNEDLYCAAETLLKLDTKNQLALATLEKVLIAVTENRADRKQSPSGIFDKTSYLLKQNNSRLKLVRRKLLHRISLPIPASQEYHFMYIMFYIRDLFEIDQGDASLLFTILARLGPIVDRHPRDNSPYLHSMHISFFYSAIDWLERLSPIERAKVVTNLRDKLNNQVDRLHPTYHQFIWQCAQKLPIELFRQAWHQTVLIRENDCGN